MFSGIPISFTASANWETVFGLEISTGLLLNTKLS